MNGKDQSSEKLMSAFFKWLEEAKKETKPEMLGFIVRSLTPVDPDDHSAGFTRTDSKLLKSYEKAVAERVRMYKKTNIAGNIYAYFSDKTMRPVSDYYRGGANWHLNRAGEIVSDDKVQRSGRGKTNHAYLAKDDPQFAIYTALAHLRRELMPGNMPAQSGEHAPEGFWDKVNAAVSMAIKKVNLSYIGELYDYIQENYPADDPNVTTCRFIIRNVLNYYGYNIPADPESE